MLGELDLDRVPAHVAVIMDGNGRWARRRGLPRIAGHKAGVKAVRELISSALELGIRYLTIFSFSSENWRRPPEEVSGLMQLFAEVLEREVGQLEEQGVRLRVLGRREGLPRKTREAFDRAEARTADRECVTLLVALNYGGRAEVADAARALAAEAAAGRIAVEDVTEDAVAARLYAPDVPDPDLVVRTSGEMRLSNFLLWEMAYSELWVTGSLWPDFRRHDLLRAVVDYQRRVRRYGGT
ncbi:MAG: isoprenyl transferase [Coriobacteriia bacterium]|nr:isoprenyl transferase [Coriobacteriia bacterium]